MNTMVRNSSNYKALVCGFVPIPTASQNDQSYSSVRQGTGCRSAGDDVHRIRVRAQRQPSSGGGDHAWGGRHMVVSGAVSGGDMYGVHPTIALNYPDDAGGRGVWIPPALDQSGATLAS
jgi:hypothetical protein